MTTKPEHTYANTHPMRYLHALDCPACMEHDIAEARQADLDAEEGYRELQAALARGEAIQNGGVLGAALR